jgi:hypothetical protein
MDPPLFPDGEFALVGHVRDMAGRPVAGAELTAVRGTLPEFWMTDSRSEFDGWFTLAPLRREEDYVLCVAPIAGAGWTRKIPFRVPRDVDPEEVTIVVDLGRTVVLRFTEQPRTAGNVVVRLLRDDASVVATATVGGIPEYDHGGSSEATWDGVEVIRDLAPGTYRIETTTKNGPLPGTPRAITVTATEATLLEFEPVLRRGARRRNPGGGRMKGVGRGDWI